MTALTVSTQIHFGRGRRSRQELKLGPAPQPLAAGRVLRIAKLMAVPSGLTT